jgi:hypothetical protein
MYAGLASASPCYLEAGPAAGLSELHAFSQTSPPTPPRPSMRLIVGRDDGPLDPQPVDSEAAPEIVEITEIQPAQLGWLGAGEGVGIGPPTLSDSPVEVNDPLYQAFVATGFLRPR